MSAIPASAAGLCGYCFCQIGVCASRRSKETGGMVEQNPTSVGPSDHNDSGRVFNIPSVSGWSVFFPAMKSFNLSVL